MKDKDELDLQALAKRLIRMVLPFTYSTTIDTILDSRWSESETVKTVLVDNAWDKLRAEVYEEALIQFKGYGTQSAEEVAKIAYTILRDNDTYVSDTDVHGNSISVRIWDDTDAVFFRCPSCLRISRLEVVQSDAVVTSFVSFISDDGYYDTLTEEVEIGDYQGERFQCNMCGHVVAEDKTDLANWYIDNRINLFGGAK